MFGSDRIQANVETARGMADDFLDENGVEQPETTESPESPSLMADTRAKSSATKAVSLVVGLMVGGLVAAFLLPVAIDEIVGVDTSSWGSGADSLWGIMDVIIVLAVFLFFIGIALSATDNL